MGDSMFTSTDVSVTGSKPHYTFCADNVRTFYVMYRLHIFTT